MYVLCMYVRMCLFISLQLYVLYIAWVYITMFTIGYGAIADDMCIYVSPHQGVTWPCNGSKTEGRKEGRMCIYVIMVTLSLEPIQISYIQLLP